jgi:hypothetical protein
VITDWALLFTRTMVADVGGACYPVLAGNSDFLRVMTEVD